MRFTLIKNLKEDSSMRPIITGLLVFSFAFVISDIFVKQSLLGLSVESVGYTLFGNEEEFLDPLTPSTFLEMWHTDIFFMMMILLTLSGVYARLSKAKKTKLIVINGVMLSGLATLISFVTAFYISSTFLYIFVVAFFMWHLIALYMIVVSLWRLYD